MEITIKGLVIKIEGDSMNILEYAIELEEFKKEPLPSGTCETILIKNLSIRITRSL